MNLPEETLESIAQRALGDISNQQETRHNWLAKQTLRQRSKNKSLKFPLAESLNQKTSKEQFKFTPLLLRRKNSLYRQRMHEVLHFVQKKKCVPSYNINNQLARQINQLNRQSFSSSNISYCFYNKKALNKRCYTFQAAANLGIDQSFTKSLQKSQIRQQFGKQQSQQKQQKQQKKLKRSCSVHISKMLLNINKNKQNDSKQIEEIKQLIQDKRNKCRKLSRQGYLILKSQSFASGGKKQDAKKHSRYEDYSSSNQNEESYLQASKRKKNQSSLQNSQIRHSSNQKKGELNNFISCNNFLRNAYQILNANQDKV